MAGEDDDVSDDFKVDGEFPLAFQNGRVMLKQAITRGAASAGLASLRVELPKRGTVFMFTTPGGDVEITARSVSDETIRTILRVVVVLGVLLLVGAAFRMGRRGRLDWLAGRTFSTLLIALGVVAVLLGFFPAAGLVAVVTGIAIKIYRAANRLGAAAT